MDTDFKKFWVGLAASEKNALSRRLKTSNPYLSQLAYRHRRPSPRMHEMLELVTGRRFTFQ